VSGFVGVAAGAFGAHALRARIPGDLLAVFETGVRYQLFHAVALLAVGCAIGTWPGARFAAAGWCLVAGTIVFSGSLYALALTGTRAFGAITPLGGALFLAGWLIAAWSGLRAPPRT
jgi:uncharacterized membrane protein YgdD (TMEM256/DUF423 family)